LSECRPSTEKHAIALFGSPWILQHAEKKVTSYDACVIRRQKSFDALSAQAGLKKESLALGLSSLKEAITDVAST